jgi:YVTN family beta-propeller protein
VLSDNGASNGGSSTQIDVSGDTNAGVVRLGLNPVHAALLLPNATRVYVANFGDDTVSTYQSSINGQPVGVPSTITLPAGSKPIHVFSSESGTMYVANSGTGTVGVISAGSNVLLQLVPVGSNPVALAETPNGTKLYSINQGSNNVTAIATVDHSVAATIPVGSSPVAAAARSDNAFVYVLNQGSSNLSVIDTSTDSVSVTQPTGAGASSLFYDKRRNRLYVTNAAANSVSIFDVSVNPPRCAAPLTLPACELPLGPGTANPLFATALSDGSRAYVLSSQLAGGSVQAALTVIDQLSNTVRKTISLNPIPVIPTCPLSVGSRIAMASSPDGSRIYVASCDAGATTILRTSDDTPVLNLPSPVSAQNPPGPGLPPPPQNPVFVLTGR